MQTNKKRRRPSAWRSAAPGLAAARPVTGTLSAPELRRIVADMVD